MRIEIVDTFEQLAQRAADMVTDLIRQKPNAVLGLPTGATAAGMFAALRRTTVSFSQVQTFNLDEYVGLSPEHPESYHAYMQKHLFDHVDVRPENTHMPDGLADDLEAEARRYEAELRQAGGLDMVLLGLGLNGHIAYNEPGAPWSGRTHREQLTEQTRQNVARDFGGIEHVPAEAITMGVGTLLDARHVILLAAGPSKAEIVRRCLEGEPTEQVPASALQGRPNVTVLLDKAAAALLGRRG